MTRPIALHPLRMLVAIVALAAAVGTTVLVKPLPASAWPSGCTQSIWYAPYNEGWYGCAYGTGYYRIYLKCDKFFGLFNTTVWGNSAAPPYWSYAKCPDGYSLYEWGSLTSDA